MKSIGLITLIIILFSLLWIAVWSWFYKLNKDTLLRLQNIGKKAFEKGKYKKSKELISKALTKGDNPELKYKLGISQLNLHEYKEAQEIFEKLLKELPENIDLKLKLTEALYKQKKYEEALEICNKILETDPKNVDCLLYIARIYQAQNNSEKAIEVLEEIKEIAPDNNEVKILTLKCKSDLCDPDNEEEYENLINEYSEIEKDNENSPEYNLSFAKIYAKNGEPDKALEACKKALSSGSEDVETYQLLGLLQLVQRDFEGAKKSLNLALGIEPKNEETHNIFSYVLCQQVDNCPLNTCREKYYELIKKYLK